jgi:hypothetical protein
MAPSPSRPTVQPAEFQFHPRTFKLSSIHQCHVHNERELRTTHCHRTWRETKKRPRQRDLFSRRRYASCCCEVVRHQNSIMKLNCDKPVWYGLGTEHDVVLVPQTQKREARRPNHRSHWHALLCNRCPRAYDFLRFVPSTQLLLCSKTKFARGRI